MKKYNGMTIVEVLIAVVITAIILSSMLTGLTFAYEYARHNANKTIALNFAQALVEKIKDEGPADYEDYSDQVDLYQNNESNIIADRTVSIGEYDNYYEVAVKVEWDWMGKDPRPNEEISTIIKK